MEANMKGNLVGLSSPMALPIPQSLHSASGEYTPGWSHPYKTSPWSPVFYADGDNEGGGNDNGAGGAGSGSNGGAGEGSGGSGSGDDGAGKGGDGKGANPDAKIAALTEEKDRHYNKRTEAETALAAAQKQLKEIEDAKKSDLEKATGELEEVRKAQDALATENQTLRMQIAFLEDNTFTWQNPKRALQLADLSNVEIKDGKVVGLDKALEALSKSDPYLLKPKDDGSSDGDDDKNKQRQSGQNHNGNQGKGGAGADQNELLKKYPALRGR